MASHHDGGGGGGPRPRRLSILSQAKDTINGEMSDMMRRLSSSSSFQQGRLSNPPQGGSISFAPTPVNARGIPMGQPVRKGTISSIPRSIVPVRNDQMQQQLRPSSSTVKKSYQLGSAKSISNIPQVFSVPRGSAKGIAAKPPPSMKSLAHPSVSAIRGKTSGGGNLRRSASIDGNQWAMNSMVTPTPGKSARSRSKSPMSMRRWASSNDIGGMASSKIRIPPSINAGGREVLCQMGAMINDYMTAQNYSVIDPNPRVMLNKLTSKDYHRMVQMAAQVMLGNHFNTDSDICKQISDAASLLKYGGSLSISHLKSASAPNALPSCVVFLCWLCTRASAIIARMNRLNNPSPVNQLNGDGWIQFSRENTLEVFYVQRSTWNLSAEDRTERLRETVDIQLALFRQRFYDTYMNETDYTLEELLAQRDEKLQELADIKGRPDPARDKCIALDTAKQKLKETIKRMEETRNKITTYKEMHSLRSKLEGLKLEIQSRSREIQTLKTDVSKQPLDKQAEKKLLSEIENLRKQRQCLQTMLDKLNLDLEKKNQMKRNLDDKMRKFMTQFTIVETCNASLINLNLNDYTIPANPMSADKLSSWLDIADETLQKAINAIEDTIQSIKKNQNEIEMTERRLSSEIKDFKKEFEMLKMSQLNDTSSMSGEDAENRLRELEGRFQEMCNRLSLDKRQTEELKRDVAELKTTGLKLYEECAKKGEAMVQWENFLGAYEIRAQNMRTEVLQGILENHKEMIASIKEYQSVRRKNLKLQQERIEISKSKDGKI